MPNTNMLTSTKPDIVDVINNYIPIKKVGSSYAGVCPFHYTKTFDAFRIDPKRQIFKCFNCGASGDVYSFIMQIEGISFKEAVNKTNNNFHLPYAYPKKSTPKKPQINYQILKETSIFYNNLLCNNRASIDYLNSRGIYDFEMIDNLKIGYAPRGGLLKHLMSLGFSKDEMLKSGLVKDKEGFLYDFFKERIVFPITDIKGNIVSFTSRAIDPNNKLRHLHLAGSNDYFFNEKALKTYTYTIITEGIFDCLTLLQEGFNAIAVFGVGGLKEEMIKKLKHLSKVYIIFDKEANMAGERGAEKCSYMLSQKGIRNYIVKLPYCEGRKIDINELKTKHNLTKKDFEELIRCNIQ